MKKAITYTLAILMASVLCVSAAQAQKVRVALNDNAYMIKGEKNAALEIDGKIVIPETKYYTDFTFKGKHFIAQLNGESFMLLDSKGNKVAVGGVYAFHKLSIVDGTVIAQISKDSQPKYFSENNLSAELKVEKADPNLFEKELEKKGGFSPQLAGQRKDIEIMEKALAEVDPIGWFEVKQNSQKGLDLMVDGKVLFNARSFTLISSAEEYKKSKCWFFIVTRGDFTQRYGVYGLSIYTKDGKKEVENMITIPYEYSFISHEGGNMVKCSRSAGSPLYFNWFGWNFNLDWRTGKYTSTNQRWVLDKATNKWSFQKQEEKK